MQHYHLVALGGTFDHFHKGHQQFLSFAFSLSQKVIIGITNERLASQKAFPEALQSFPQRRKEVVNFLKSQKFYSRTSLVILNDIYGPTLQPDKIQALVATKLTYPGTKQVNHKRQNLNLKKLPIHVCPMIKGDDCRYLSSTRIRQGLVARCGQVYRHLFKQSYHLTNKQRLALKKPLGKLIRKNIKSNLQTLINQTYHLKIALVGDFITNYFVKHHLPFNYAVVDWRIARKPATSLYQSTFFATVKNPAGQITSSAAQKIFQLIKTQEKGVIRIIGEEDLLTIPMVLSLPLTSLVIYGQPDQGCVVIPINEESKKRFVKLLTC